MCVVMVSEVRIRVPLDILSLVSDSLKNKLSELELEIKVAKERIRRFEEKYGMDSDSFLKKYEAGSLGDDEDFVAWYGELMFLKEAEREYEKLKMVIEDIRRGLSK